MPPERRTSSASRRVCFVTGTRAEFGLMESTLRAIRSHSSLKLQIVVTGTHTHPSRGLTVGEIRRGKWRIDHVVNWEDSSTPSVIARETGRVSAALAEAFDALRTDIVLVVGDRVEAFAAATAGHLSGRVVAHVHGGDRAMGQADDSLRHAITKLAHVHFPATPGSQERLIKLGEDRSRIRLAGAPGIDGIRQAAASRAELVKAGLDYEPRSFNLLLLHPTDASDAAEKKRTNLVVEMLAKSTDRPTLALLPNNDPGARGIAEALHALASTDQIHLFTHISRRLFLGLMRDCRLMIGNSSAGIIEAGSFATPVVDIGPRQQGRERGRNVVAADWNSISLRRAIARAQAYRAGRVADNPYDRGGAAARITSALARVRLDGDFRRKLIAY